MSVRQVRASQWRGDGAKLIILAYTTDLQTRWMLGITAAHYKLPLMLVGAGMRWRSDPTKQAGVARAMQLLGRVAPGVPIMVLDGSDTAVANRLLPGTSARLERLAALRDTVLVGTECILWPVCRKELYQGDAAHRQCVSHWPACFPNSGAMVASPASWQRIWPLITYLMANSTVARTYQKMPLNQVAIQDLYFSMREHNVSVEVDGPSNFFASTATCKSSQLHRRVNCFNKQWAAVKHMRFVSHERGHADAAGAASVEYGLEYNSSQLPRAPGEPPPRPRRPLIVHANGDPQNEMMNVLGMVAFFNPAPETATQSALLTVDTSAFGVCAVPTLGDAIARLGTNTTQRPYGGGNTA